MLSNKYKCENEKIQREFTISYKQYTGEEALGEGMSLITGEIDTWNPDPDYTNFKVPYLADGDEKYIVGPYNILAKMENVSSEASCYKDIKAAYDVTFYMYLGQGKNDIDDDGEDEILDCYTNSKKGSITFDVDKTGHKAKEGTRVEAKAPTDLKNGNFEFYLCDNDKDEGTIVVVDGYMTEYRGGSSGYEFVDPEVNLLDKENIGKYMYCDVMFDEESQTFKYEKDGKKYTYNFNNQKFECTGQTSISAIPVVALDYPLWYGYTVKEGKLVTPEGYIAESHECEIYPHYAYYYYNGQYIIEKENAWFNEDGTADMAEFGKGLDNSKARVFIPEDEAVFDEFGILEQAHILDEDGNCVIKNHVWSEFKDGVYVDGNIISKSAINFDKTQILKDKGILFDKKYLENNKITSPSNTEDRIRAKYEIEVDGESVVAAIGWNYNTGTKECTKVSGSISTATGNIIPLGSDEWEIDFNTRKFIIKNVDYDIVNDLYTGIVSADSPIISLYGNIDDPIGHIRVCTNPGCKAVDSHYETGTFIPTSAGHYVFGAECEHEDEHEDCHLQNTYGTISELFGDILAGNAKMYDHNWVDANAEYLVCADCGFTKKNDAPSVKTTSESISLAELDGKEGYRQTYTFDINSNGKEIAYYGVVYNKDTRNIKGLKAENLEFDNKGELKVPAGYKFEKRTAIKNKGTLTVNLTSDSEDKYVTVMGYVVYMVDGKYEIATTEVNVNTFEMKAEEEFDNACSIKLADDVAYDAATKKFSFKYDIETSEGFTLVKYGCMVDKEYDAEKSKIEDASYDTYQTDGSVHVKSSATNIKTNGTYTVNVKSTSDNKQIAVKAFITVKDKYGMVHNADSFDISGLY